MDLASLRSVQNAAKKFLDSSSRLDILFNNAGVMAAPAGWNGGWIRDSHVLAPWLVPTASLVVLATVQHSALNKLWAAASKDFQIGEFDVPVGKKAGSNFLMTRSWRRSCGIGPQRSFTRVICERGLDGTRMMALQKLHDTNYMLGDDTSHIGKVRS